jgi:hypothetical protein
VGTHDWNKFLQPSEVKEMLERVNMNTRLVSGMLYLPGMYRGGGDAGDTITDKEQWLLRKNKKNKMVLFPRFPSRRIIFLVIRRYGKRCLLTLCKFQYLYSSIAGSVPRNLDLNVCKGKWIGFHYCRK